MSDLSDVFDMKCFTERVINGTYDQVADAVDHLGKDALANADFGTDWGTAVEDHTSGTNWLYVDKKTGRPFRTNIVGQITCSQFGTKHSAKGTHFSKKVIYPMLSPHPDHDLTHRQKEQTTGRQRFHQMEMGIGKTHPMFFQTDGHLGGPTNVNCRLDPRRIEEDSDGNLLRL
jgi:hypothetical protein